jgi:hypothetical protein
MSSPEIGLARRVVEFIDENDPFGDKFCRNDVKRIEDALQSYPAQKQCERCARLEDEKSGWVAQANAYKEELERSAQTQLPRLRPVAFRVPDGPGSWAIFQDELTARDTADAIGVDYQGLYVRDGSIPSTDSYIVESNSPSFDGTTYGDPCQPEPVPHTDSTHPVIEIVDRPSAKSWADENLPVPETMEQAIRERNNWCDTAARHCRNEQYYRGLVIKIGEMLGREAYVSDDGSVQEDVLCAKVPALVRARLVGQENGK